MDLLQMVEMLLQGAAVTTLTLMWPLGLMAAAHQMVALRILHMHCQQRWFASLHLDPKRHKCHLATIPHLVQDDVCFWRSYQNLLVGTSSGMSDVIHGSVHIHPVMSCQAS